MSIFKNKQTQENGLPAATDTLENGLPSKDTDKKPRSKTNRLTLGLTAASLAITTVNMATLESRRDTERAIPSPTPITQADRLSDNTKGTVNTIIEKPMDPSDVAKKMDELYLPEKNPDNTMLPGNPQVPTEQGPDTPDGVSLLPLVPSGELSTVGPSIQNSIDEVIRALSPAETGAEPTHIDPNGSDQVPHTSNQTNPGIPVDPNIL